MVDVVSTHQPEGDGGPVEIHVFVPEGTEHQAERWRRATEGSLDVLGSRVGVYPYETVTVVFSPIRAMRTVGMEYPTLFTGMMGDPIWDADLVSKFRLPEVVIAHEFVHQYFYGIVGSNEFEEAFLDEGFTQYWGAEAMIGTYGDESGGGELLGRPVGMSAFERSNLSYSRHPPLPVWSEPSYLVRGYNIGIQFYYRPATIFRTASGLFGRETMDRVFALYYQRWAFRHPRFEDFLNAAREAGGEEVADFLLEAFTQPDLPDYKVAWMRNEAWSSPRGRIVTDEGIVENGPDLDDDSLVGLDPAAHEIDGTLLMEVLDPGSTHGGDQQPGRIERRAIVYESGEPDEGWKLEENEFHLSEVRIEGPGWRHLPVEVRFRFADGAVVGEIWDGRARYRTYRFLRAAPLSEVRLDPEGIIAADPDWVNNAEKVEADGEMVNDWSMWLGGLFQVLMEGMSQWL
jgi:hypothetical protein